MSRERYLLQRDEAQSRRDIRESEERAAKSRSGINLSSGIGRGLGLLGAIALAPTGASPFLLGAYGGLGSAVGSFFGGAAGKYKHGGPEKADVGLFNRDIAREQRKGVDQYWQGLKEQTAVNTLQDAVTAGMYGAKIKSGMADAASSLGFDKTAIKLGGYPKGMGVPTAPVPIEQVNTAGLIPDSQQLYLDQIKQSNIARADSFGKGIGTTTSGSFAGDAGAGVGKGVAGGGGGGGAGQGMNNWIENLGKKSAEFGSPVDIAPNLTGTAAVGGGYGAGVTTDANILTGINAVPTSDTAISSVATNLNAIPSGPIEDIGNLNFSGKSSLFSQPPTPSGYDVVGNPLGAVGSGPMPSPNFLGDAVNNANLAPDTRMQQRILDYKNKNWAPDDTINMDLWNQISGLDNINIPYISGGY